MHQTNDQLSISGWPSPAKQMQRDYAAERSEQTGGEYQIRGLAANEAAGKVPNFLDRTHVDSCELQARCKYAQ